MKLRPEQIAAVCKLAGCPDNELQTYISIALAESRGVTDALNDKNRNGTSDYGLFQINSIHNPTSVNWKDPVVNATLAARVSSNWTNPKPWVTYPLAAMGYIPTAITGIELMNISRKAGKTYQEILGAAKAPDSGGGGVVPDFLEPKNLPGVDKLDDVWNRINDIWKVFTFFGDVNNLKRSAYAIIGVIVLLTGLWLLARSTATFKKVEATAADAAVAALSKGAV